MWYVGLALNLIVSDFLRFQRCYVTLVCIPAHHIEFH